MYGETISFFLETKWTRKSKTPLALLTALFFSLYTGTVIGAEQLLCDPGFESSIATGTFSTSGCWKPASAGGGTYAGVTTTAAHSGNNGLWIATGAETWSYWCRPYQRGTASAGQIYTAKAWIRTPSGESWIDNSLACVRIEFLDSSESILKAKNSAGITTANSAWSEYSVTSDAAPANTTSVRFICNIEKPSGVSGVSVANFDDTYLELTAETTPTPTITPTPPTIPTPIPSPTPKISPTPTATSAPTATPTSIVTPTPRATETIPMQTPSPAPTQFPTPVASPTISQTPTLIPAPTPTPRVTPTAATTPSPTPSVSPTPTITPQATATPTPPATPKPTPSPTPTASPTPANDPVDLAYQHLSEVMDKFHNAFDVYTDQDAGGNHFYPSGWMGATETVSYNGNWTEDYYGGTSCIKIQLTFPTNESKWVGIYWQDPENNWGTQTVGGYDLSGATKITFRAKGENGGEKIEFYAGGITGNNPDSLKKTYAGTGTITTLSDSWKEYTIDLTSQDLSHVIGGFGWSANSDNNPNGATFYLDNIQYNKSRLDEPRFLVSYETLSLTDPDRYIKNACHIYDNALALIAFLKRGTSDDLWRAKILANAFVYALQHDRSYTDTGERRLRNAYMSGDLKDNSSGFARLPGWWNPEKGKKGGWDEDKYNVSTYTGNMAWAMIALLSYYEQQGGSAYLDAAKELGEWIYSKTYDTRCTGGYNGGYEGWEKTDTNPDGPTQVQWKSTEHNIDVYVAFMRIYDITKDSKWKDRALHAKSFVEAMWDEERAKWDKGHFWTGTYDDGCKKNEGDEQQPEDTSTWGLLALRNASKHGEGIGWVEKNCYVNADGFKGFDFNTDKDHVWFEGTAHMALAYQVLGSAGSSSTYLSELRKAQTTATNNNGKGIVAASHDGLTTGFKNINDKDWLYYSRLHVGATAWFIFAEKGYNPYWGITTEETATPAPSPTPSPAVCKAEKIEATPNRISLKKKKRTTASVSVTGNGGCPVEGQVVTATINTGKKYLSVSPMSTTTDENGNAEFAIRAKNKTGAAVVTLTSGNLMASIIVKVR